MSEIYQEFKLDTEEMRRKLSKLNEAERRNWNPTKARKTLVEKLTEKGFTVLGSNASYCGIPESILVGGQLEMGHKEEFYKLSRELGLAFSSGVFYTNIKN